MAHKETRSNVLTQQEKQKCDLSGDCLCNVSSLSKEQLTVCLHLRPVDPSHTT